MGGTAANKLTNTGTGNPQLNGVLLGEVGGVEKHTLTTPQMPGHSHSLTNATDVFRYVATGGWAVHTSGGTMATYPLTAASAGGGEAHPNVQPTAIANFIIKY